MPESAWKLVFYTMSWSYSTYLLFFTSYSFFHDPPSVFYSKMHASAAPPPALLLMKGPEVKQETRSRFLERFLQVIMNQHFIGVVKAVTDAALR